MNRYALLLRGINVGGKNAVPMAELKQCLEELGLSDVRTLIASGNVAFSSTRSAARIRSDVETMMSERFTPATESIRSLVLPRDQFQAIVDRRPPGFGDEPETYHSDVIFLIGLAASDAIRVFSPRDGVDRVWAGDGVIYSQRLSAERTRSRLNRVMGTPEYRAMTIRNWNTTTKLLEILNQPG